MIPKTALKIGVTLITSMFIALSGQAQKTFEGIVSDTSGNAVSSVSVSVKGTKRTTFMINIHSKTKTFLQINLK